MKVLLCEDVEKLGYLGDIVEVKEGYARNYLLPQRLAKVPTEANVKSLAQAKVRRAEERKIIAEQRQRIAEAVNGAEVVLGRKANEQGHLFGSVAQRDIAEGLRAQGFEISDDMVHLGEHLKETGNYEVLLKVAPELSAKVTVVVVSQEQDGQVEPGGQDKQE